MEELKSTESLDREIEADALRKAEKIKRAAAAAADSARAEWQKKLSDELAKEKSRFEEKASAHKLEVAARLSLDKRRLEYERTERCLREAARAFLAGMERKELLGITGRALNRRFEAAFDNGFEELSGEGVTVEYRNLSRAELDSLPVGAFGAAYKAARPDFREEPATDDGPSVVFDMPALRITASAQAEVRELLLEKREELKTALLGEDR